MKARGKREARRPGLFNMRRSGLKGRNTRGITPCQGWVEFRFVYQGRRASRLPLAFIFRAFGAALCVPARGASRLPPGFHISRLWRCIRQSSPRIKCTVYLTQQPEAQQPVRQRSLLPLSRLFPTSPVSNRERRSNRSPAPAAT